MRDGKEGNSDKSQEIMEIELEVSDTGEVNEKDLLKLAELTEESMDIEVGEFNSERDELLADIDVQNECLEELSEKGVFSRFREAVVEAKKKILSLAKLEKTVTIETVEEDEKAIVPSEKSSDELAKLEESLQNQLNSWITLGSAENIERLNKEAEEHGIKLVIDSDLFQSGLAYLYYGAAPKLKKRLRNYEKIASKNEAELDHEEAIKRSLDKALEKGYLNKIEFIMKEARKRKLDIELRSDLFQEGIKNSFIETFNLRLPFDIKEYEYFAQQNDLDVNIPKALQEAYMELLIRKDKKAAKLLSELMSLKGIELPLR
jgi:hypothetical protein